MIAGLKNSGEKLLSGIDAFKLYDTYGFPLDLTRDVLAEEGLAVDEDGFNQEMEKQRERARQAREETGFSATEEERLYRSLLEKFELEFTGYEHIDEKSNIIAIVKDGEEVELAGAGDKVKVVLEKTPFMERVVDRLEIKGFSVLLITWLLFMIAEMRLVLLSIMLR